VGRDLRARRVAQEGSRETPEEHPTLNIQRPTAKGEKTYHEAREGHEEEKDPIRKSGTAGREDRSSARWAATSGRGGWRREGQREEPALGAVGPPLRSDHLQEAGGSGQVLDLSRWRLAPFNVGGVLRTPIFSASPWSSFVSFVLFVVKLRRVLNRRQRRRAAMSRNDPVGFWSRGDLAPV
jgi:hypothetical protein